MPSKRIIKRVNKLFEDITNTREERKPPSLSEMPPDSETAMSKLRMEKRRKVMTFTPVYDLGTNVLLGYLGDLTLKGGLLVSETPIKTDRTLTLGIEFRETSEEPAARMNIPARVAWCKVEDHRTYYNTGLEFQKMSAPNKKKIQAILEKYQFNKEMPK